MIRLDLFYYRHNCYDICNEIKKQLVDFSELTVLLDGEMVYVVNGERMDLRAGDAVFLQSGDVRERYLTSNRIDYVSFNFNTQDRLNISNYLKNALTQEMRYLIAACDQLNKKIGADKYKSIGYVLESALMLLQEKRESSYSELTERILEYLSANYSKKITLRSIADEMHFSEIYCDAVFKSEIGKPIIDYLIDVRLEEAKNLLVNSEYSVKDVSYVIGYADQNYFSRLFKQRVGYTPTNYRSSILQKRYIKGK